MFQHFRARIATTLGNLRKSKMRGATVFAILTIGCGTLAFTTLPAAAFGWYRPNEPTIGYYGPGPRWWEREL